MKAVGKLSSYFTINYQKTGTQHEACYRLNSSLNIDSHFFSHDKMFCLYHSRTHTITDPKLFSSSFWHILSLISLLITLLFLIYQHVCTASSLLGSKGLTGGSGSGQILRSMLTSLCPGSCFDIAPFPCPYGSGIDRRQSAMSNLFLPLLRLLRW